MKPAEQKFIEKIGFTQKIFAGFMLIVTLYLQISAISILYIVKIETLIQNLIKSDKSIVDNTIIVFIGKAKTSLIAFACIGFIISMLLSFFLSRSITNPVIQILNDLKQFRKSNSSNSVVNSNILDDCIQKLSKIASEKKETD